MHYFSFRKLFGTCLCCSSVLSFRNGKRGKVGGEAKGKMHGQLFCSHKTIITSRHMAYYCTCHDKAYPMFSHDDHINDYTGPCKLTW